MISMCALIMRVLIVPKGLLFSAFCAMAIVASSFASPDCRVSVNGCPMTLVEAPKPTKYWKGQMYDQYAQPYWAALVDAHGDVEVRVESDSRDLSRTRIIPEDKVSQVVCSTGCVTFRATVPFNVSVEPDGRYRTIAVIAREPDRHAPKRDDSKVRYFASGHHHLDEPIRLKSNQTLYLEEGAFVEACVFASGTNIAIRGHGVLSGVPWPWKKGPQTQFVHFKGARDVLVKDVTLLGPYHWSLVLQDVEHAVVDGIAVLGGRVINDDGIDICRCHDVTVRNSFFHVQDDNIAIKWWAEDVTVEKCTFWADVARIVHIGGESDPAPHGMRRIKVRDFEVLHQSICKPSRGEPIIHINASNEMPVEDVIIENGRIWAPEWKDMFARIETVIAHEAKGWAWYDKPGRINGVTIKNINYKKTLPRECGTVKVLGCDTAHPVRNVTIEGLNFTPESEVNEHVENVNIKGGVFSTGAFVAARPIWISGEEKKWNSFCAIRYCFKGGSGTPLLRLAAAYDYRVRLNGCFVGFGPVRGPAGVFRIDEWRLDAKAGDNVLEVEAAGYNCNCFYFINQPSFVQAEVMIDGKVAAATGVGDDFKAFDAGRIRKVPRFSSQRTFIDAWRIGGESRTSGTLSPQPMKRYESRPLPYPNFAVNRSFRPIRKERLLRDPSRKIVRPHFIEPTSDSTRNQFSLDELETNPYYELQEFKRTRIDGDYKRLETGESVTYEGDRNAAGFIGVKVRTDGPCRIVVSWDEILKKDGMLDFSRLDCAAVAEWHVSLAGEYKLETFEPYAAKYIDVTVLDGVAEVDSVWVRTYVSPMSDNASFCASDSALERIFLAARESFRANAVDGFTDCPTRERAYWSGDTFFTARASAWLTGDGILERNFLSNFLLVDGFDWTWYDSKGVNMDGAIPALYPGGILWRNFIPNYMMWTVLQLEEYVARYGDWDFAEKAKRSVLGIVRFLKKFRNGDGLLEKLPGWVFVEWSKANQLVQDVNYPSNMMYARVLEACASLYKMPELAAESRAVRNEIVRQSWTGEWFCDNAVRQQDGSLKLSGESTETCQYCAFFFGAVTPESHPLLWNRMLNSFGPERIAKGAYPRIWPANFIFGTCERLELLSRARRSRQIFDETRDWFLSMAERTGTLWEHLDSRASCCHGFAAIASEYLFRDVLGVREIDRRTKTVRIDPDANIPLEWCEGTLPLSGGDVATIKWRKTGEGLAVDVNLPTGWSRQ